MPESSTEPATAPWFEEMTEASSIDFRHVSGRGGSYYFPEHIGSGLALFDYDGDGDLDLFLVQSGLPPAEAAGENLSNRLWRHESDGRFVDRTVEAGLLESTYGMGATVGDYDVDGDLDLFVSNYGADALYQNQGDGTFVDVTAEAGIHSAQWSTAVCFFHADEDAFPDLFIVTYVDHTPTDKVCSDRAGRSEYCGPAAFRAIPDILYLNNGDGTFRDGSEAAGISRLENRGLGVACLDVDGDHRQDVLVANDGEANQLWINQGGGRFEEQGLLLGVATNALGKTEASMGVAVGDIDGDLDFDFFLTHLDRETNTLYLGLGETDVGFSGFGDATARFNLGPESLSLTGFGTAFADLDHDGDLDLLIANGRVRRGPPLIDGQKFETRSGSAAFWHEYAEPDLLFENLGQANVQNTGFRLATAEAGAFGDRIEIGRALAAGDLDHDGDLDIALSNNNGLARLFRNTRGASGGWLQVEFSTKRSYLGATVKVLAGEQAQIRAATSHSSYLVGTGSNVHFGLGEAERIDELTVVWPDGGRRRVWKDLPANRRLIIRNGDAP